MMQKFLIFVLIFFSLGNALTLEEVRESLRQTIDFGDSVEMSIKTTVSSPWLASVQGVSVYLVRKGSSKIFAEVQMPFSNRRTIVNGQKMKIIDLNTRTFEILPYNEESLDILSYSKWNPLDSGTWKKPQWISGNLFSIQGEKSVLYYDKKKKRIEKTETNDSEKFVSTEFFYDEKNNLKSMHMSLSGQDFQTSIVTEVFKLNHSRDFPDNLFEF